jgi:hypothetical protein
MFRRRGQKSLYEAINSAKPAAASNKPPAVVPIRPAPQAERSQSATLPQKAPVQQEQKPVEEKIEEKAAAPVVKAESSTKAKRGWPGKPKPVSIVGGRLEMSLPYAIVIAAGLVLILVMLLFFRLGQFYGSPAPVQNKAVVKKNLPPAEGLGIQAVDVNPVSAQPAANAATPEMTGKGSNRIVIKIYSRARDLEPAKDFFDRNGIETEIVGDNAGNFKLVTKNRSFSNPNLSGTDGFDVKQKIIGIGKSYKAPQGYEQFRFEDPYGEKVQ